MLSSDEVASSNIIKDGFLEADNKRISLQRDRWQVTAYSRKRGVQLIFPVTAFEKIVSKDFLFGFSSECMELSHCHISMLGKLRDFGFQRFGGRGGRWMNEMQNKAIAEPAWL